MLVVTPADLIAVVIDGDLVARAGTPRQPQDSGRNGADDSRLGPWADAARRMTQYLTPDGHYSETRHGRRNAYTGQFWLTGGRIT